MISSMTGYGRAGGPSSLGELQLELRSVNGKHLDLKVRTPRFLFPLEPLMKKCLQSRLARGRVECNLLLDSHSEEGQELQVNETLVAAYLRAARSLQERFQLADKLTLESLLRLPEVVRLGDPTVELDGVWREVEPILERALKEFCAMRRQEGEQLRQDFLQRLDVLCASLSRIEVIAGQSVQEIAKRLRERVGELCRELPLDEARLTQEVAFLAERADITEELVRLRSHFDQFRQLMDSKEPAGRKMDFLLQEMFREVNTIGSKTEQLEVTRLVLDMKTEVDKLREQAQNVE